MKIVVFGATGRTGRLLIEGALDRGHNVTAFVRAPDELGALEERVRVVRGDVLDGGAVSDAVDGQEAALVALGDGAAQVAAKGTLNVVRSMQRYGVRRLVVLSSASVAPPDEPGYSPPGGKKISRADVAAFMLDELERPDNVAHALAIAY